MDRRKSIKALVVGTVSTGLMIEACKPGEKKAATAVADTGADSDRMQQAKYYLKKLTDNFFTAQEMATLTVLADIIVPKDAVSGSASDAKVPDFLEFIVKDMPKHQTPMRGGLRWLDVQCLKQYGKAFTDCDHQQQIAMVDQIAYPAKAKPEMKQGVSFFNLMRNLTLTGFFTSEMGVKDLGYAGNTPNRWNGVPDEVLKQYGLAYSEKELKECVSF